MREDLREDPPEYRPCRRRQNFRFWIWLFRDKYTYRPPLMFWFKSTNYHLRSSLKSLPSPSPSRLFRICSICSSYTSIIDKYIEITTIFVFNLFFLLVRYFLLMTHQVEELWHLKVNQVELKLLHHVFDHDFQVKLNQLDDLLRAFTQLQIQYLY